MRESVCEHVCLWACGVSAWARVQGCDCRHVSVYEWACKCEHTSVSVWEWACKCELMCEHTTVSMCGWGYETRRRTQGWVAVGGRQQLGRGCRCPGRKGRALVWDTINSMAVVAGTGDQQHPATALLLLQTHVPVLWLRPEASHYKRVSHAGHGKRAKKTIWTWEGIWAALELGKAGGISPRLVPPPAPFKRTPGTGPGN